MIPVPVLIGAAVAGGIACALSGDDKSNSPPPESKSTRILSENQLPRYAKRKLEEKRNRSDGVPINSQRNYDARKEYSDMLSRC